jgi:3-(3-hydroxy-phenyl)propionate hydroxylase
LVAGAGPVGILNALGLAQAGVDVTIIERSPTVIESPRAIVYHWSVLEGLEGLGVLDEALALGFKKQDYQYHVWATGEKIKWSMEPLAKVAKYPYNIHLGQNVLAKIALKKLEAFPNTRVIWSTKITGVSQSDDQVTVDAIGPDGPVQYTADWLIGADGAGSAVRESLNMGFDGVTWPERFVATNVRVDFEGLGYGHANLQIDPVYGAIIAKIDQTGPTGLWRMTYMEDASLPEESVGDRMPEFYQTLVGDLPYEIVSFSPYRMHQRSADTYRLGRVLLAGDAAHATNPTGGLGLTSGLFDTFALYPALAAVIKGQVDDSVLDEYSRQRRRIFLEVASPAATENKRLIYGSKDPQRLEQDLGGIREQMADPEKLFARLTFPMSLKTEPLVPMRTASA